MDLTTKWYALAFFYFTMSAPLLHLALKMYRAAQNPAESTRAKWDVAVYAACAIGVPAVCIAAPMLFASMRVGTPEFLALEGPMFLLALLGLVPMSLAVVKALRPAQ